MLPGLNLDAYFGKVIRTVKAGQSFGELALLHKQARRTATVIACAPESADSEQQGTEFTHGVELIRIARRDYDLTVSLFRQPMLLLMPLYPIIRVLFLHCNCRSTAGLGST